MTNTAKKTGHKPHVTGPLLQQGLCQSSRVFVGSENRYFQLEHKKRNGNRKHPVAKSLKSPCLFRFRCSIYHLVRQRRLLSLSGAREYQRPTKIQTQASPEGFVSPILKAGQDSMLQTKKRGVSYTPRPSGAPVLLLWL